MSDKQYAELAAAAGAAKQVELAAAAAEAPVDEPLADAQPVAEAGAEEINMEDVLPGVRKQPAAAKEAVAEVPEIEHQTL
jgi:hypothetical protein